MAFPFHFWHTALAFSRSWPSQRGLWATSHSVFFLFTLRFPQIITRVSANNSCRGFRIWNSALFQLTLEMSTYRVAQSLRLQSLWPITTALNAAQPISVAYLLKQRKTQKRKSIMLITLYFSKKVAKDILGNCRSADQSIWKTEFMLILNQI